MGRGQIQLNNGTSPLTSPRGERDSGRSRHSTHTHMDVHHSHTGSVWLWLRKRAAHTVERSATPDPT
ncbi:hypothetical protein BDP55DRAFT_671748 [Colletotrichum godetiae]|uniref:Uncharacterized protein n=1 Tax=Colletotrichum godetiae TaxID=1209918 RepID=A0AAJ0ESX8_9PEZI|nr:uncharacterized protein BDP55DRAFT_671748 [Colletotrichum godetiae]KAK1672773.1 hypothetical protein BDP55DRAFT_671748 [Colletotrichum godetiae]